MGPHKQLGVLTYCFQCVHTPLHATITDQAEEWLPAASRWVFFQALWALWALGGGTGIYEEENTSVGS